MNVTMTSSKPYLIRAVYEWLLDNSLTPYIAVDTTSPGVRVPVQYIKDNKIILNITPSAVHNLLISNSTIEFKARFNNLSYNVRVPVAAVIAIYALENNRGIVFPPEETIPPEITSPNNIREQDHSKPIQSKPPKHRPNLVLVKGGQKES